MKILVKYYCLFLTSFSASQLSLTDPRNASKTRSRSVANSDSGQSAQSYQAELLRSYLEQVKNYTFPHQGEGVRWGWGCSHDYVSKLWKSKGIFSIVENI